MRVTLQGNSDNHSRTVAANNNPSSSGRRGHPASGGSSAGGETGRLASLQAYSELPRGVRPELVKSSQLGQGSESGYHALSDEVRDQTVTSMFSAAAESLAGYAMAEGAAAGSAGAAAGATSAGVAGAGSAAMGAAVTAGWIGAAIYGAVRIYEKFNMYLDRAHGAPLTDEEIIKASNPRGIEQWLSQVPGHTMIKKLDPVFLIAKGLFGSSKNTDQIMRDRIRAQLKEAGVVGENYLVQNPDGSTFDIGKDGGEPQYQLNVKNPMAGELVTMVAPLAMVITGGNKKLSSDFTGYLVNAALSGAGAEDFDIARRNISALYEKAGVTADTMGKVLLALQEKGDVSEQEYQMYSLAMDTLTNGVSSSSQLEEMTVRVEKRQKLLDEILTQSPDISTEELTKLLSALEQVG